MDQDRWTRNVGDYHWILAGTSQHRFLRPVFESLGFRTLRIWIDSSVPATEFSRTRCGGLITAVGRLGGQPIAIAWSDFRVNAASYGHANSRRLAAFLQHIDGACEVPIPLIYVVNSAGLSLMEGRKVFADAFALWPVLLRYSANNPVLTCAVGKCLGLAPLLFGLGHYRVAVARQTQVNLTGPEVLTLFFGPKVDFAGGAAAERVHDRTDLIHEMMPSVGAAFTRFAGLLSIRSLSTPGLADKRDQVSALLSSFLDADQQEVVPGWCESVRLFLGTRHGRRLGVFVNPPGRPNNLITVRTLDKYAAGLELFRALRVPVVSLLDSPGIDPRFEQTDANNLRRILSVGERIISYPHGAMGVVTGRCFGGASTLSFPKVFGGSRTVAFQGCRIGTMHDSIIARLLGGSPRLRTQWEAIAATQGPDLSDLLREGTIDAVILPSQLGAEVDAFLEQVTPRFSRRFRSSHRSRALAPEVTAP